MNNPITPTVGRVVLVRNGPGSHETCGLVTKVHSDNCINIMVMHDAQGASPAVGVMYDDSEQATAYISWRWMPYQIQSEATRKQAAENEGNSQS